MPQYTFYCPLCDLKSTLMFSMSEYPLRVHDEVIQHICPLCNRESLMRRIIDPAQILGGTNGYKSFERYWAENPDVVRKNQAKLERMVAERKSRKSKGVTKERRSNREDRYKHYPSDRGEEKLNLDHG